MPLPEPKIIDGGPKERAEIFRRAAKEQRSVSVGYRRGGKLEVRDLTGMDFVFILPTVVPIDA